MVQKGIPGIFIFCRMVWNEITKFRVFFFSTKEFGAEFQAFLSSAEWLGMEFPAFSFRETGVISKKCKKISTCSVFRGINFSRKLATLTATQGEELSLHCYYTSLSPSPAKTFSISFIYFLYWVSFHLRVSHFPFPSETFLRIHEGGTFRFRSTIFLNCACFLHS
jgi:hypothetical protein